MTTPSTLYELNQAQSALHRAHVALTRAADAAEGDLVPALGVAQADVSALERRVATLRNYARAQSPELPREPSIIPLGIPGRRLHTTDGPPDAA